MSETEREKVYNMIEEQLNDIKDVGEWLSNDVLDVEYTIGSNGDIREIAIQLCAGNPTCWLYFDGSDYVRVEYYFDKTIRLSVRHPKAKEIFDYLEELGESLICKH